MATEEIQIRYEWHSETSKWNYSIVDTIDTVIETTDARNYWKVLKNRLKKRDASIVNSCNQLKMRSRDGKHYLTDTADSMTVMKIVRVVSSSPTPDLEAWMEAIEIKKPRPAKKSFPHVVDEPTAATPPLPSKASFSNRLKKFLGL